jgi:hypothetical protein
VCRHDRRPGAALSPGAASTELRQTGAAL